MLYPIAIEMGSENKHVALQFLLSFIENRLERLTGRFSL